MMPGHGGGRNTPMSATRIHRLRVLACQKIAAAYRHDEVACSVMVMQGGSVFDDIAQRVLRAGRCIIFSLNNETLLMTNRSPRYRCEICSLLPRKDTLTASHPTLRPIQ
jgi:hypothetical protein